MRMKCRAMLNLLAESSCYLFSRQECVADSTPVQEILPDFSEHGQFSLSRDERLNADRRTQSGLRRCHTRPPVIKCGQSLLTLDTAALLFVANAAPGFFFERDEQVEGDIGGVEALALGVRDVVDERAERGLARDRGETKPLGCGCGVETGEHAGGDRFGVSLNSGDLAG